MARKMIVGLALVASLLASGTVTASPVKSKNVTNAPISEVSTVQLCSDLGSTIAYGGAKPNDYVTKLTKDILDEVTARKDWNPDTCLKGFERGALKVSHDILQTHLEE